MKYITQNLRTITWYKILYYHLKILRMKMKKHLQGNPFAHTIIIFSKNRLIFVVFKIHFVLDPWKKNKT